MRTWPLLVLAACGSKEAAKKPPPDAAVVITDVVVAWGNGLVPDNVQVQIAGAPAEAAGAGVWKGRGKGDSPPVEVTLVGPCGPQPMKLTARAGGKVGIDDESKPRILQLIVDNAAGKAKQVAVGSVTITLVKPEEVPRLGIPAGCVPAISVDGVEVGKLAETTATVLIDPAGTACYQAAFYMQGGDVYDPRPVKVLPFDDGKGKLHPMEGTYDEALGVKLERVQEGAFDATLRRAIESVPC